MSRMVYEATCPGCGKRIRAPSADERRARVLRHIRNCAFLKQSGQLAVSEDATHQESAK